MNKMEHSEEIVRAALVMKVGTYKSVKEAATALGLNTEYLRQMVNGVRPVSPAAAKSVGFIFERKEEKRIFAIYFDNQAKSA